MLKDTVDIPLSFFVEDLQMIWLDNRDEALVGNSFTTVTDNYVLVRNNRQNPYKLFNIKGEFITTIGAYGQGPNEYLNVYDEWLDEKTGQIFILPWQSDKLLRFDLQGKTLEPIPLKYRVPKGRFFVNTGQSTVSVFLLPFAGIPVVAWTQDFSGNMLDSIPVGHLAVQPDYSNEVDSYKNTGEFDCSLFTFFEQRPDSLYHYNIPENRLEPKFTLDFKDRPWKIHSYQELPLHFTGDVTVEKKLSDNTSTTESPSKFIVDKKTLKGGFYKLYNDFLGDIPIEWPSFERGYYVWNVDPCELADLLTKHLDESNMLTEKDRKKLTDLLDSIDENDNNYLFYGKLRQSETRTFGLENSPSKKQKPKELNVKSDESATVETTATEMGTRSKKESLSDDPKTEVVAQENPDLENIADSDTTIYESASTTARMEDAINYLRHNNRYKDWDKEDKRTVFVRGVVEKDGKLSHIIKISGDENEKLREEAVRLLRAAEITPAKNERGENIRSYWVNVVEFPPR